jgi:hypothetical protein
MRIKSQNLLRLLLIIPYLAWGIALTCSLLISATASELSATYAFFDIFAGVTSFYAIGIIVWGIPYTALTLGLLLWSIQKPESTIYKVFALSPFFLAVLTLAEIVLIYFWPPQVFPLGGLTEFLSITLVVVIPTLLFGYAFVGIGILVYKAMGRLDLLRTETKSFQVVEAK